MYPNHVHPKGARKCAWGYYALILSGFLIYSAYLVKTRHDGKDTATTTIKQYDVEYSLPKMAFCPQMRITGPLFTINTDPSPLSHPLAYPSAAAPDHMRSPRCEVIFGTAWSQGEVKPPHQCELSLLNVTYNEKTGATMTCIGVTAGLGHEDTAKQTAGWQTFEIMALFSLQTTEPIIRAELVGYAFEDTFENVHNDIKADRIQRVTVPFDAAASGVLGKKVVKHFDDDDYSSDECTADDKTGDISYTMSVTGTRIQTVLPTEAGGGAHAVTVLGWGGRSCPLGHARKGGRRCHGLGNAGPVPGLGHPWRHGWAVVLRRRPLPSALP